MILSCIKLFPLLLMYKFCNGVASKHALPAGKGVFCFAAHWQKSPPLAHTSLDSTVALLLLVP